MATKLLHILGISDIPDPGSGGSSGTGSGFGTPTAIKTANYNAVVGDFVRADPSLGGFNVTLPSAAASGNGAVISVKNISTSINQVTVLFSGGDTSDGATSVPLDSNATATFVSDGVSDWMRA